MQEKVFIVGCFLKSSGSTGDS